VVGGIGALGLALLLAGLVGLRRSRRRAER